MPGFLHEDNLSTYYISSIFLSGRDKRKRELIKNLETLFKHIQDVYNVSAGDFPDLKNFKEKLAQADFKKFKILDPAQLHKMDKLLSDDVARLMEVVPAIHHDEDFENSFDGGLHFGGNGATTFEKKGENKYKYLSLIYF